MSNWLHISNDLLSKIGKKLNEGGEGSGNFGHAGRPGEIGGSAPEGEGGSSSGGVKDNTPDEYDKFPTGVFNSGNSHSFDGRNTVRVRVDADDDTKRFANLFAHIHDDDSDYHDRDNLTKLLRSRFNAWHTDYDEDTYTDKKTGVKYVVHSRGKSGNRMDYTIRKGGRSSNK